MAGLKREDVPAVFLLSKAAESVYLPELPLVDQSLLALNLATLRRANVKEVLFVGTKDEVDAVRRHFDEEKEARRIAKKCTINYVNSTSGGPGPSDGDLLRDAAPFIRAFNADFLIIRGGSFFTHDDIQILVENHKVAKKLQSATVWSRLLGKSTGPVETPSVLVRDSSSGELLMRQSLTRAGLIAVDSSILGRGDRKLEFLKGTAPAGVELVGLKMLEILEESFDFQTLNGDVVDALLNSEVKLDTISVFSGDRSTMCRDSSDIARILLTLPQAVFDEFYDPVGHVAEKVKAVGRVVVESGTVPGADVTLENCLIGKHVNLGGLVSAKDAVIFANSVLLDDDGSLDNVVIGPDGNRRVLFERCTGPAGAAIPPATAAEFFAEGAEEDDSDADDSDPDSSDDESVDESVSKSVSLSVSSKKSAGAAEAGPTAAGPGPVPLDDFQQEILRMFDLSKPELLDNKMLEVKSYRLACNRSFADCLLPLAAAIVAHVRDTTGLMSTRLPDLATVLSVLVQSEADQVRLLEDLLTASSDSLSATDFCRIVKVLYGWDVLEEEGILAFAKSHKSHAFLQIAEMQKFLEGVEDLLESSDDSSEGSSDEQ